MNQTFKKYIILILGIYVLWLVGIPLIFSRIVPVICENITYNTQYNVRVAKPKLYTNVIPTSTLKAEGITITSKNNKDSVYIDNFKLKIRLLPLLTGKLHLDIIQASSVNVNYNMEDVTELDKDFVLKLLNTKVVCDAVRIDKFKFALKNINANENAIYEGNNIYYAKNIGYLKFNIASSIKIQNQRSIINAYIYLPKNNNVKDSHIDVELSNLDIAPICDYFKNYLPADTKDVRGIIDLNASKEHLNLVIKNGAFIRNDDAKSIVLPQDFRVNSGLNLTRKDIIIDNAEIKSENINTVVNGIISNYFDKPKPEINLSVRINKSRIEDFISMLPPFKTEDIDAYKLKKYKFYGDVLGNFTVKGDIYEPNMLGSIYINNGVLTKPIPNTKGATIKLDFRGKYLNFDVLVPAGIKEKVMVKGGVELYNVKYSDMRVWSTDSVDLATAEEKVVPIHEILNFVIGPVPIMDIKGNGNIDIIIKGNRKTPHVWGALNFNNTTTNFKEVPNLVLHNANAILTFDDENAVFNLKSGIVDGKDIKINGTCNMSGKFDFDVKTDNQHLAYFYNAIKTSSMIDDIKNMIPVIEDVQGFINLRLKVYGNIRDISYIKFKENFFTKGQLELLGNSLSSQGIKINDTKGTIDFDNTNANINVSSLIGPSPLNVKAVIKDNYADADISVSKLNLNDIITTSNNLKSDIANIIVDVVAKYKGRTDKIEYDKVNFNAKILDVTRNNKLKISKGVVSLKNGKLQIKDINGNFVNSPSAFNINLIVDNLTTKPIFNGKIMLKDFELSIINTFSEYSLIPNEIRNLIKSIHFDKGKVNMNASIINNNVNASTDIGGIAFTYAPLNLPIKIVNGSVYIRKNYLGLNKINLMADDLPILIDGGIHNVFSNQDFDIYINSKPKQTFVDKYFNNNQLYPLKIKGDIVLWAKIKGVLDDFNIESEADMEKDSSVYYMGATIGDIENAIILNLDMDVIKNNILKIKEFSYDKLIASQGKRRTRLNMVKVRGGVDVAKDDFVFHDLKIKTSNPTDARIFNIIFRKPNIKQGQFTSDLKLNGRLSNPYILGSTHIVETNIPFLDTTMKNLSFIFKEKNIEFSSKGEIMGNDVIFNGILRNKLTKPYYVESAELYTKILDLNYIANKLKSAQIEEINTFESLDVLDLENIIIKTMRLTADQVLLRNLVATNIFAKVSINNKQEFKLNNFKFDIANGLIEGDFIYNLQNSSMGLNMKANKINANDISIALFELKNQIYGDLTGNMNLKCNGSSFDSCMQTVNGSMTFNVKDGKMPKLGSLEYLLKAGNLVKGGITGLSVNSLIDVLTPLKTGEFSDIYGVVNMQNGVANDIEISTKGKDLSLFITGQYNFASSQADMEVLGLLSKKISTMFGPVGNMSINTLFNVVPGVDLSKDSKILDRINKIPGIELNEKSFRKFIAEIYGDINGDNYVKSFKWIN